MFLAEKYSKYGCITVYSSIGRHLCCFQVLAITNKRTTNISAVVFWDHKFKFIWDKCPGGKLLGNMEDT